MEDGQFQLANRGTKAKTLREQGNMKQFWGSREQNAVKGRSNEIEIKDVKGTYLARHCLCLNVVSVFKIYLRGCSVVVEEYRSMSHEFTLGDSVLSKIS